MSLSMRKLGALAALAFVVAACSDDTNDSDGGGNGSTKLATPSNVVAQATSSTEIGVTFGSVTGAVGYIVERADGATGGTFAVVAEPTVGTFNDTGLLPSTTYRYRVTAKATTASLNSDPTSEVATTTLAPGRTVVEVTTDITTSTTWVVDNVYRLRGFRKVANGATLTIAPGTRIEGDVGTTGSSLFVLRGARIIANGTAALPIVFTSSQAAGTRQPGDWGGLVIVGNGIINRADPTLLEGTGTTAENPAVNYAGGTDNADNSGTLRYVRVEFAGFGPAQDAELNSYTFAAVGSGTTMEYLESLSGLDDSFEWFGGAVDGKYFVSYESGDDHFDMSEGYIGRLQYLIAFQSRNLQPRPGAGNISGDPQAIENDGCNGTGCANGQDSQPFTVPLVANFTLIGFPAGVTVAAGGGRGMVLRRGTGGYYVNGLIGRYPTAGLSLRDNATTGARLTAGLLDIRNHLVVETPALLDASTNVTFDQTGRDLRYQAATTAASLLTALPTAPTSAAAFDWTPLAGSAATTGGLSTFTGNILAKAGAFVTPTTFVGAADPAGTKWWQGWTNYAAN
ncbi:MAG TPA: fibronectin type III domain-containing protein [Gemmatimonadales bacterium]|nr:fibronectin type III domain-containing protein [Gemmatimonadales bacterium]